MQRDASLIQPITGFPEWLPSERLLEVGFIDTIRRVYESFGFTPIETPAVEKTATLESKGEIHQQIYSLMRPNVPEDADKDTGLSLHQDLTVPLARYVAQHYGKWRSPSAAIRFRNPGEENGLSGGASVSFISAISTSSETVLWICWRMRRCRW